MRADLVLVNGDIRTMDPARPQAGAMAIGAGRILALGDDGDMRALAGRGARIVDAGGRLVLPGFQDAHVHLLNGGLDLLQTAWLYDVTTLDEMQAVLAAHARTRPGPMVVGAGWQPGFFGDRNLTRQVLDTVVSDRPCLVYDCNFHNACLNSAACRAAGIDRDTPDPLNGHIVRGPDGEPTGMLHEEAINWVLRFLPQPTDADYLEGARAGQAHANRHGITGIVDPWLWDHHLRAYGALAENGGLTVRVAGAVPVSAAETAEAAVARLSAIRSAHQSPFFRINAAKYFLDGGLENRTAAMIAPYADAIGGNAPLMFTPGQIADHFTRLDAARFQIHVHCIGDLATRAALDGFESARAANGPWPSLHQIAHVEVVHADDMPRFRVLGVMANMQPLWAVWDPAVPDTTMDMVGPARLAQVYAFRSLIDAGAPWCVSSDFAVTTLNPFEIIGAAVTREPPRRRGRSAPFNAAERMTVGEAVMGYTVNAAAAAWREHDTGVLRPGLSGDFILLDRDVFACDPYAIAETEVMLTVLAGREVHRAAAYSG